MAIVEIKIPSLGTALETVTIGKIYKKVGDNVNKGEPIMAVESSKVSFDVYASEKGIIREIRVKENNSAKVGDVVAILETSEGEIKAEGIRNQAEKEAEKGQEIMLANSKKIIIYPAAEKIIKEHNLDISELKGTGPKGAITRKDVLRLLEKDRERKEGSLHFVNEAEEFNKKEEETIPFTGIRRAIAINMTNSLKTAAHVTTTFEIDMTPVLELRKKLNEELKDVLSYKIYPMAFLVKAISSAINEYPIMNSILDMENEKIIIKKYVNLNYAVDTEEGLLAPVIRNVDKMNLLEINNELHEITHKVLEGKLTPNDMTGGTITLSNAGANGAVISTPIINQPQTALIWTGVITKKPTVINGEIVPRDLMNLCISYDHRVIDGAKVAKFAKIIKEELEHPYHLLVGRRI